MLVFERSHFTNFRKVPPEFLRPPVRYRMEHAPGCDGICNPEEAEEIDTDVPLEYFDIKPLPHPQQLKWDMRFLGLARYVSTFSKDPSTKVGAVVARADNTVLSLGFNGFPRGCDDDREIYADRERKYERVVHAEMNAILTAPERPKGCTLYVWPPALAPGTCGRCAAAIIQAGITRVVRVHTDSSGFNERWQASYKEALQMYLEAGVIVVAYELEEFREWMKATQGPSS